MRHGNVPRRSPRAHHGARGRRRDGRDRWQVAAPISRFVEPVLLLSLRDGPSHGYDLAEKLAELTGAERVDYGNLYRLLRRLEHEGIVTSQWRDDVPGRSKRTYELTPDGTKLLEAWAMALEDTQTMISTFLKRFKERNPT